jgi:hypothetical protein
VTAKILLVAGALALLWCLAAIAGAAWRRVLEWIDAWTSRLS